MRANKGIEAGFQLILAPGGLAKPGPRGATIIERHRHLELADNLVLILVVGHVEDGAIDNDIEFWIA